MTGRLIPLVVPITVFLGLIWMPGGFTSRLHAGDAIVFGTAKANVEPQKEKLPVETPFKLEKFTTPQPFEFNGMTPLPPRRESNPRKDKKQQNAEDEKRNWMFLEKGELNSKDAENSFLGVRDDEQDDLDLDKGKGKGSRDYMFKDHPNSRTPGQPRPPGASRKGEANQPPPPRQNREEEMEAKRETRSSAIVFGNLDRQVDLRIGGGLDLQSLLGSKAERESERSVLSLGGLLPGTDPQVNRERHDRDGRFRELLNSPAMGGISDPINVNSDFTRQPLNPVLPSLGGSPKMFDNGASLAPRSGLSQPNNSWNSFASPDASTRSSFGSTPATAAPWKATEVPWPKSRF